MTHFHFQPTNEQECSLRLSLFHEVALYQEEGEEYMDAVYNTFLLNEPSPINPISLLEPITSTLLLFLSQWA